MGSSGFGVFLIDYTKHWTCPMKSDSSEAGRGGSRFSALLLAPLLALLFQPPLAPDSQSGVSPQ
jgi:hypothetical protein